MTARKIIYTIINTASLTQHYYEHYNYNYIDTEATEKTDQGVVGIGGILLGLLHMVQITSELFVPPGTNKRYNVVRSKLTRSRWFQLVRGSSVHPH